MQESLYSVGTWDTKKSAYTLQRGLPTRAINVTRSVLKKVMRQLQDYGYSVHRRRDRDGDYSDNATSVLIERTDGMPVSKILENWKR